MVKGIGRDPVTDKLKIRDLYKITNGNLGGSGNPIGYVL